jgi:hypothetical protein
MSRPKGSKNKAKGASTSEEKVSQKSDTQIKQEAAEKHRQEQEKTAVNDEHGKYQTTPMSNWAIENRKKKLGLKD